MDLDVTELSDDDLARIVTAGQAEQARRALENADISALTEHGFQTGFASSGLATDPQTTSGLLVAHGAKNDRTAMNHQCSFVRVADKWAWESEHCVADTVRHLPGPKPRMRSVTVLAVPSGTPVDLVTARTRNGVHELVSVRSFITTDTGLELVSTRAVKPAGHRL